MDRREFLKNGMLAAGATIAPQPSAKQRPQPEENRLILPINRGWRFAPTYTAEMTACDFDQTKLEQVTIPHTNVRLPWHSFDEKTYQFKSVYRRDLKIPAQASGKRIFVDFEGAMTASTVFLNGKELGSYRGGYTPFSFELGGGHLEPSGRNSLAVVLDSSDARTSLFRL